MSRSAGGELERVAYADLWAKCSAVQRADHAGGPPQGGDACWLGEGRGDFCGTVAQAIVGLLSTKSGWNITSLSPVCCLKYSKYSPQNFDPPPILLHVLFVEVSEGSVVAASVCRSKEAAPPRAAKKRAKAMWRVAACMVRLVGKDEGRRTPIKNATCKSGVGPLTRPQNAIIPLLNEHASPVQSAGSKGVFPRVEHVEEAVGVLLLLVDGGKGLVGGEEGVLDEEEDGLFGADPDVVRFPTVKSPGTRKRSETRSGKSLLPSFSHMICVLVLGGSSGPYRYAIGVLCAQAN